MRRCKVWLTSLFAILLCGVAQGSVVVHVGCDDPGKVHAGAGSVVQLLDTDSARVAAARKSMAKVNYGQITAALWDGKRLPYADNLVNLIVIHADAKVPESELRRVLVPNGMAVGSDGKPILQKPRPDDIDEWSHFLHSPDNNAVSRDTVVAPPRCLQWVSDPVYGRHHDKLSSISAVVSAGGRLFSIEDRGPALSLALPAQWQVVARDAFNGVTLWTRQIDAWQSSTTGFRSGPTQLPRRLVAVGDRVYVTLGYGEPVICLDGGTGEMQKKFKGTEGVDEILHVDGTLYLAASVDGKRQVLAVDVESGKILWRNGDGPAGAVYPATLTVGDKRLFFHDGKALVAIARKDGKLAWRTPLPSVEKRPSWLSPTVVFHDGVVLCGDRATEYPENWKDPGLVSGSRTHGGPALLTALSADDGKELWKTDASEAFHGAVDVFVIDGLVWASKGPARSFFERTRPVLAKIEGEDFYIEDVCGRNLRTGKIEKKVDAAEAYTLTHHHRCYRNKATERYIILGRTGIEFVNLTGGDSLRNNWTRGACQYGVMPANGLLYTPPHPCACYNASKMNGFFAYSGRKEAAWSEKIERLTKGPATIATGPKATAEDWPTFRHDNARSGCGDSPISDKLKLAWTRKLSGRLSAPTSADGKVFVAEVDRHTVRALDLATGEVLWSHIAGGRVDSPPTYHEGNVYFGAADGSIQCLTAADGKLVWRFFAAPEAASIIAWDQLASPWPIAGSVLVRDGSVYALAGRSSNLDGGMIFLTLDAATGKPQRTKQIYRRDSKTGRQAEEKIDGLYMPGLLYDIPSSRGDSIFLREAHLTLDGEMSAEQVPHLYSVGGFLDDTWWHRYYMLYGTRFKNGPGGGVGRSGGAPFGRLLVCDGKHVFGYGRRGREQYHLFCSPTDPKSAPQPAKQPAPKLSTPKQSTPKRGRRAPAIKSVWSDVQFPIMVRAMNLAGEAGKRRLIVAGPPATALRDVAALRGKQGGRLAVIDAATGKTVSEGSTDAAPVFDGMCTARGRVLVSFTSGEIAAFK